jgi:hypothetical protein
MQILQRLGIGIDMILKYLKYTLLITNILVVIVISSCSFNNTISASTSTIVKTPTILTTNVITSSYTYHMTSSTPNTGSVTGRVLFTDNTPAYPNLVYIFESGILASVSIATTSVDTNGYYYFSNIPVGIYEIYTAIYKDYTLQKPDADLITVVDQHVTTVPLIIVTRWISNIYCEDTEINSKNGHVSMVPLSLSWTSIPNTNTYSVTITSNSSATPPGPIGYDSTSMTTGTSIIWPVLQPGSYTIVIKAFDQQNTLVGIGTHSFIVGQTAN